jgi:hypothetical protein
MLAWRAFQEDDVAGSRSILYQPDQQKSILGHARPRGWLTPRAEGVTEVRWDSRETQLAAVDSAEGKPASALMAEDEPRFIHAREMIAFLCTETVIR